MLVVPGIIWGENDEDDEEDEMDDENMCICGKCPWAENHKNVR